MMFFNCIIYKRYMCVYVYKRERERERKVLCNREGEKGRLK
jgi:hypothetical protein